ncbi:hypothetical protein [Mesobacillus maritimus]|nr:hypothetical protein [Mesobacillus maritimus]
MENVETVTLRGSMRPTSNENGRNGDIERFNETNQQWKWLKRSH